MSQYKGAIFDLDGTLLNTIEDLGDSMNKVLNKFDVPPFSYEEYKIKVGGGFRGLVINCFPKDTDSKLIEEAVKIFSDVYDKGYLNKSKPYDGIVDTLYALDSNGIKLGINSNKKDYYTQNLTEKFFKGIPFIKVYGERQNIPKKPNATSALEISKLMNLEPKEVIFIGDSKVDIITANNAGMKSIGVLWGFRNKTELMEAGADYIVSNAREILDIIL